MKIARSAILIAALGLAAPEARPAETNPEVVKAVRALLSARKDEERDSLKAELLKRADLDWASVRKGLEEGPYYQKPLETAFGERRSNRDFDLVFSGEDGQPRGFTMWVPKSYDGKAPLPVLVYLHHAPSDPHVGQGAERAGIALIKFRDVCEERGIFFVAPYTSKGAEWWTPTGRKLVSWTLRRLRERYSIDDDRIGLVGALAGGDAVWYLGQEMPGTWSVLMPMSGDPFEITAIVRPLFLATLDRMDVLMGIPGKVQSTVGEKDLPRFLADLKPMFDQRMRITTAVWPTAQGDFSYLEEIRAQIASFVCDRKRKGYADEVDIEVEAGEGLRSLWLRNDGYDAEGSTAPGHFGFHSTHLKWTAPARAAVERKLGVQLDARPGVPGLVITATPGEAKNSQIFPGDVLLEIDGAPVAKLEDVKAAIGNAEWESEVRLLLARDVKDDDLARHERREERYARFRRKVDELKAAGQPVPNDLWDQIEEAPAEEEKEEAAEEEDEGISVSDESAGPAEEEKGGGGRGAKSKIAKLVERWVKIRRPGGTFVRADFGAGYDPGFDKEGVRIGSVFPGSLAGRSGLKEGDILVQVGDSKVRNIHDVIDYFDTVNDGQPFRFEEEPDGQNSVDFTVRAPNNDGTYQADRTVTVRWAPVRSSRVDARWDKRENTLHVLANRVSGFTLYFTDDLIEPGKEFHLLINGVPYLDLVDPATAPDYPKSHDDAATADELYRMRRKRAKCEGWKPDIAWAIEEHLGEGCLDRRQVYGAKRSFDLTKMKDAFEKARKRGEREDDFGERVRRAYDEFRERSKG